MPTTVPLLTPAQGLAQFERNAAALTALIPEADLDAPVAACPGWTFADLVAHVGEIHQWARHAVLAGSPDGPYTPPDGDLAAWYAQHASALAETLRTTDPDAPVWHFGPKPRTAAFWSRRQAHETAVHLYDAAHSQGLEHELDPAAALDAVDEALTMFYPRQVRLGRIAEPDPGLTVRTAGHEWTVGREPAAAVEGPPDAVLLLLWNRIGLDDDRLTSSGDRGCAAAVLAAGIVP
ncbi:maleylpyruvate isomerase family mycothiol-dependent enzyme [Spongisporangium articulatum]|uniref:Maleylpyruvate isomerase family mycothiol-dependent enzyme n=1 Tax=Spongisporangium articulatum TaxID=3362603 RepID=A0ABW8AHJ6_9ACTN